MALTLAIPLFGLNNDYFSTLNTKLLNIEREQRLEDSPDSGWASPNISSVTSGTSGISSIATSSIESTPISSRSETPVSAFCKSQAKTPDTVEPIRIMYKERDILNLGSNIRQPCWQLREQSMTRQEYKNFLANRTMYHQLRDQAVTKDYPMKRCKECGFYSPAPLF